MSVPAAIVISAPRKEEKHEKQQEDTGDGKGEQMKCSQRPILLVDSKKDRIFLWSN